MITASHEWSELALVGAVVGFAVALGATELLVRIAPRLGLVDKPDPRKIHHRPVPRIGGVAVFLGIVSCALVAWSLGAFDLSKDGTGPMLLGASAMFLLGFLDDIFNLAARWKLVVQVVVASCVVWGGVGFGNGALPFLDAPWALGLVSVVWIVGVTNAMNLIDGMDGLATGVGMLVAASFAVTGGLIGAVGPMLLALAVVASLAAFLVYNYHPAKIFLGDCGSLTLGFLVSVLAMRTSPGAPPLVAFWAPLVALGFPIFDTLFAIARRTLVGRGAFTPDRDHIHHHLLAKGFSQRKAAAILHGITALFCLASLGMHMSSDRGAVGVLFMYGFVVVVLVRRLDYLPGIFSMRLRQAQARHLRMVRASGGENWRLALRGGQWGMHSLDIAILAGSWGLAAWIRPEAPAFQEHGIPILLAFHVAAWLFISRLYECHRDIWRLVEFNALGRHIKSASLSVMAVWIGSDALGHPIGSRLFVLVAAFSVGGIALARVAPGFWIHFGLRQAAMKRTGPGVLVFGAGENGALCAKVLGDSLSSDYRVVGFVDEDPALVGRRIHGHMVLGQPDDLLGIFQAHPFDLVVLSGDPSTLSGRQRFVEQVRRLGVAISTFRPSAALEAIDPSGFATQDVSEGARARPGASAATRLVRREHRLAAMPIGR